MYNSHTHLCLWAIFGGNFQVAKLSKLSGRISELEKDLAAAMTKLAASEEGLKQANIRVEKADALTQVSGKL